MSDLDSTVPAGFRVIPGFPRYAIDENGTVMSVCSRSGRGKDSPWINARTISHAISSKGYHQISLCGEKGIKQSLIHALVLEVFVGPRPNGYQCRHLDGNKDNNHVSNLSWGTNSENERDKLLHGTSNIGERHSMSKLTNENVIEIRRRRSNGESLKTIANDFSVSIGAISRISIRKTWKHVT